MSDIPVEPIDVCLACKRLKQRTHINYCSSHDKCWLLRYGDVHEAFNAIEKAMDCE